MAMVATLLLPATSDAALVITATKGPFINWTVAGSGSLNTAGLISSSIPGNYELILPRVPTLLIGPSPEGAPVSLYSGPITGPASIGIGDGLASGGGSGDFFGILTDPDTGIASVILPEGYVSGSPLSASSLFVSWKTDGLALTPGSHTWTLPNDTITLHVMPEPSASLLLLPASGLLLRRRRLPPRSDIPQQPHPAMSTTIICDPGDPGSKLSTVWFKRSQHEDYSSLMSLSAPQSNP